MPDEYYNVHQLVKKMKGRASDHDCVTCGCQAQQWAYDHKDPNEAIDTRFRLYSTDPDRYQPMCRACHRALDWSHDTPADRDRRLAARLATNDQRTRKEQEAMTEQAEVYDRYFWQEECFECHVTYMAGVMMNGVCFRCRLARRKREQT